MTEAFWPGFPTGLGRLPKAVIP